MSTADSSTLLFRASNGQFSAWSCACGCDLAVTVTPQMEQDVLAMNRARPRFYVKHHAPLGIDYAHKGNIYDFAAQEPLQATLQPAYGDVLAADKNSATGLPEALESELEIHPAYLLKNAVDTHPSYADEPDDPERTPVVHLKLNWNEWPDTSDDPV